MPSRVVMLSKNPSQSRRPWPVAFVMKLVFRRLAWVTECIHAIHVWWFSNPNLVNLAVHSREVGKNPCKSLRGMAKDGSHDRGIGNLAEPCKRSSQTFPCQGMADALGGGREMIGTDREQVLDGIWGAENHNVVGYHTWHLIKAFLPKARGLFLFKGTRRKR